MKHLMECKVTSVMCWMMGESDTHSRIMWLKVDGWRLVTDVLDAVC